MTEPNTPVRAQRSPRWVSLLQWAYVAAALIGLALLPRFLPDGRGLPSPKIFLFTMAGLMSGFVLVFSSGRYFRFLLWTLGFSLSLIAVGAIATTGFAFAHELEMGEWALRWPLYLLLASEIWVIRRAVKLLIRNCMVAGGLRGFIQTHIVDLIFIAAAIALVLVLAPYWAANPYAFLEDAPSTLFFLWAGVYGLWYPLKRNGPGLSAGLFAPFFVAILGVYTLCTEPAIAGIMLAVFFGFLMTFGTLLWWAKKGLARLIHFARFQMTARHWSRFALAVILLIIIGWRGYVTYRIIAFKAEYSQENYPETYILPKTRQIPSREIPATESSQIFWRGITFTAPWPGAYLEKEASGVARFAFPNGIKIVIIEPFHFPLASEEEIESRLVRSPIINLFRDITSEHAFDLAALDTTPDEIGPFTPSWVFLRKEVFVLRKSHMPMSTDGLPTFVFSAPHICGLQTVKGHLPAESYLRIYSQSGQFRSSLIIRQPDSQDDLDFIISSMRVAEPGLTEDRDK